MITDPDLPDYNDTNQGDPRETPEEKEIAKLESERSAIEAALSAEDIYLEASKSRLLELLAALSTIHRHELLSDLLSLIKYVSRRCTTLLLPTT